MQRIRLPKNLFTTSYPSVCGWAVLENLNSVLNCFHKVSQNAARNLLSMDLGTPWSLTTSRKNRFATWWASVVLRHGMKWAILENLSTTTNTTSLPRHVLGKPKTKSIEMSSHGATGTGKGMYNPVFWTWPLQVWHTGHRWMNFPASLFSCGQK